MVQAHNCSFCMIIFIVYKCQNWHLIGNDLPLFYGTIIGSKGINVQEMYVLNNLCQRNSIVVT